MCGIAATFNRKSEAPTLELERIRHRGPDSSGSIRLDDRHVWLGHCRLSILDLSSAGDQPMQDGVSGNWIIFNGEIYNHLTLRRELEELDRIQWRGHSDTETLLVAYRLWGPSMLQRLKGMFAFIIYDEREHVLFVARDRFGIKPLYFGERDGTIYFGSETRLIRDRLRARPTPESIAAYLQFGASPERLLLYPEVKSFPAGTWMKVSRAGRREEGRFWPPDAMAPLAVNRAEAPKLVRTLLEQSVREHLLSDVRVAVLLSGGIDSSIITALAAQASSEPLYTFSVGFPDDEFDETSVAREVADRYGTKHERIELREDEVLADVTEAVSYMDLPSVDAINTYIVTKRIAQRGIKVVLSGLGGDELFGGYPIFNEMPKLQWLSRTKPLWCWASPLAGSTGQRLREIPGGGDPLQIAIWRRRFWTHKKLQDAGLPIPHVTFPEAPVGADRFTNTSWAEMTGYMRRMLLRDSDQMSMAHSLELRVPFLDADLTDAVLRIPERDKRHWPGIKGLLVEACRDLLPASVYNRPKMGFTLPMDQWMRGPLKEFTEFGLAEARKQGIRTESIESAFREQRIHWTRIWSAAVLGQVISSLVL